MNPLSETLRKRVLIGLFFLFLILTPLIIGYTKGYRLGDALELIQTGGIYLHSDVGNTSVFIDDEFIENNGAFLRNTLVQNLLPNRYYKVRVQRDGYQSWQKVLHVRPKLVTEARILMIPETFLWRAIPATSTIAAQDAVGLATTSDATTQEVVNPEYENQLEFFTENHDQFAVEVATSTYEYIRGERFPTTTIVTMIQFPDWLKSVASSFSLLEKEMVKEREGVVTWLENGNVYAVWAREDNSPPYFFCFVSCKDQLAIQWEDDIKRYSFFPNRNDVLIILTKNGIYAVELDDRSQRNIQPIIEESDLDFRLQYDGTLTIFDGTIFRETTL